MCAQLFTAKQIKEWDAYTIATAGIGSIDLMEKAARACADWLQEHYAGAAFVVFCGKGNNGGDGLAIARLLGQSGYAVCLFVLETGKKGSVDFEINLERLQNLPLRVAFINSEKDFPVINKNDIVVDALFGIGLSAPLLGLPALLVQHINQQATKIVSIDLPSGLFADQSSVENVAIKATHTLTFEQYKIAHLLPENATRTGLVHVLPIGLNKTFTSSTSSFTVDAFLIKTIYKPRQPFAHKGNFGHALLVGGGYGKMGAIVLAANASLRSGAGLTTVLLPSCGYYIMQTALPEVMARTDDHEKSITGIADVEKYSAIGIGPGLGTEGLTKKALIDFLSSCKKTVVLDADALNILAEEKRLDLIPAHSIITPHPKEFERLFGKTENDFERLEVLKQQAQERKMYIVLKGRFTAIATPEGEIYFNTTGNAGLAKGGSGDVLTGMITALLAQGYTSKEAALLGVYLHGSAADEAAKTIALESMTASDVVSFISKAFRLI